MLQPFVDVGGILVVILIQGSLVRRPVSINASILLGEIDQPHFVKLWNQACVRLSAKNKMERKHGDWEYARPLRSQLSEFCSRSV